MKGFNASYYYNGAMAIISFFARFHPVKKQPHRPANKTASQNSYSKIRTAPNSISCKNEEDYFDKWAYLLCLLCGLATIVLMVLAVVVSML